MIKKFKDFVNENINEGADWVLLRSGNVCVDSYSLCFLPLVNGLPDMHEEIEPDDPEYDEILSKLDAKDKEIYDEIKQEARPID